jgi:hypothetical protein
MIRIVISAALALAVTLPAVQAQAQSIRTFVSTAGSDSNPCSLAAPCRHFQAAVNATALGGEVDALDPGAYGSFTISQGITIEGQGWSYVAPPNNGIAITINAGSGNVAIHGVSLNGVGATGNTFGIAFTSAGGSLTVVDSVIRNFTSVGIAFEPGASSQLSVSNTLISNNVGASGILVLTVTASALCTVDNVRMEGNDTGLNASTFGSGSIHIMVRNSTMTHNASIGLLAQGANTTAWLTRSTITENATDFDQTGGAVFLSYADNNIVGNTTSNGPPGTIGYQ